MGKKSRVSVNLTKPEIEFIESFGEKCKAKGGRKLSRNEILRAMVKVLKNLKVNPSELKDKKDLIKRICNKAKVPY